MWLELFLRLGFPGFYALWAFLVGAIAVFGVFKSPKDRGLAINLLLSWAAGIFLVSISPIGGIIFAVFFRLAAEGIRSGIRSKAGRTRHAGGGIFAVKLEPGKPGLLAGAFFVLFALGILTMVLAPPLEVDWYKMRNADIITADDRKLSTVSDISWEDIKDMRLVSQEYALQVPKTMVAETGWRLSGDWDGIYAINNTLYWVMAYEPARIANNAEPSPAYIIVDAQNPADRRKITEQIEFSEERSDPISLLYQIVSGKIRDVKTKYWLKYPFFEYGDAVFTHDSSGAPAWFAPVKLRYPTGFVVKFYTEQAGIVTLDNAGDVKFYSEKDIRAGNAPSWLVDGQVLVDEYYSEERVWKWAKYASWKGFLNYYLQHENVFELSRNLYFQHDKDTGRTYGLLQLEPEGVTRKAITHYIEIDAAGKDYGRVQIYDTRNLGLIGPKRALDDVTGEISLYSDWYALQPLFKKIKGGYFYVVPVYSGVREAMALKAVAVVDAKSEQVRLFMWGTQKVKDSEKESTEEKTEAFGTGCQVVSSEQVDEKLRIVIECEN